MSGLLVVAGWRRLLAMVNGRCPDELKKASRWPLVCCPLNGRTLPLMGSIARYRLAEDIADLLLDFRPMFAAENGWMLLPIAASDDWGWNWACSDRVGEASCPCFRLVVVMGCWMVRVGADAAMSEFSVRPDFMQIRCCPLLVAMTVWTDVAVG
ncbi:hypothetical protein ACLOJK_024004 [Asimina triloba]